MPNAPIVSKSDLMALVASGQVHESFEHSEHGIFDITVLRALSPSLAKIGLVEIIAVELSTVCSFIRESRDYEEARIRQLSPESIEEPILALMMSDDTSLLIDGTHRALRRERDGEQIIRLYRWPFALAELFGRPSDAYGRLDVEWGDPNFWEKRGDPRPEEGK